jgi:hypothetical protein
MSNHVKLSPVYQVIAMHFVTAMSPSEIFAYEPPPGIVLVGDNHITRGSVFVIGGALGVGKSRALLNLLAGSYILGSVP